MIRQRENPIKWQAGVMSLLVHGVFFLLLVMTFSLKNVQPVQVSDVELWDSVPLPKAHVQPEPPKPELKPEPKVEPKPEPKPEPPPEPKAEIQLKSKPPLKPKQEKKPEEKTPKPDPKLQAKQEEEKKLKALQQAMLEDSNPAHAQDREAQQIEAAQRAQAQAAAASGAIDAATAKIVAKIKRYVNPQVCGTGKPVVEFGVALMPTGEVIGAPQLQKSSGISACDQAVERAILQAQPLPVPREPELFAHFRDLSLKFRPNDNN